MQGESQYASAPSALNQPSRQALAARDDHLVRLLVAPGDRAAMAALIRMQRVLAGDDARALRRQAAAYLTAVAAGTDTGEHYTVEAMRLLAAANLQAVLQIERTVAAAIPPAPAVVPARPRAGQAGGQTRPPLLGAVRTAAARTGNNGELFLVVSGPIRLERTSAHAASLTPLQLSIRLRQAGEGMARLQLGAFNEKANAEALAQRARRYDPSVTVIRGRPGSGPTVRTGAPVQSPAILSLTPERLAASLMEEGVRLYQSGWFGPALVRFRRAAAVAPAWPRAYLWWGRAAMKVARLEEARQVLGRVLVLAPESEAAREAARLLAALGRSLPVENSTRSD